MRFEKLSFGSIKIGRVTYKHDVLIDRGDIVKRKKKRSQRFRKKFGHTPLSPQAKIPRKCKTLVVGTGNYEGLPVMKDVKREARRRNVKLVILSTRRAIKALSKNAARTNAVLHVTC
jgi:hypothetical protein